MKGGVMVLRFFELVFVRKRGKVSCLKFTDRSVCWADFRALCTDLQNRDAKITANNGRLVVEYSRGREEVMIHECLEGEVRRFLGLKRRTTSITLDGHGRLYFKMVQKVA